MSFDQPPTGMALVCDERGIIRNVLQFGIDIAGLAPGQPCEKLADSGSRIKLLNFLAKLRDEGIAFDWEVNIPYEGKTTTLRLTGIMRNNGMVIIGAYTPYDALGLCDELMKINSEQANALRTAIKNHMQTTRAQSEGDAALYDEISRLNNDLVTLQRDLAKKNAELERLYAIVQTQAITDSLTGLYNRRGFFEISGREIERAKRYNRPLAAIMFDLDRFKKINDTYGHTLGDHVLKEVATRCVGQLRKTDIFGRYGGEEFSILLPETPLIDARQVAERLRYAVDQPIQIRQTTLNITISLGVATLKTETADLSELLQYADRALYQAKATGRNCTCIDQE